MQPYTRKACGPCISLKTRCDHARPCARCLRKGIDCVDVARKPRQKKEKPTITQHVTEIEQIVNFLQKQPTTTLPQQITQFSTYSQAQIDASSLFNDLNSNTTNNSYNLNNILNNNLNDNSKSPLSFDAEFDAILNPSICLSSFSTSSNDSSSSVPSPSLSSSSSVNSPSLSSPFSPGSLFMASSPSTSPPPSPSTNNTSQENNSQLIIAESSGRLATSFNTLAHKLSQSTTSQTGNDPKVIVELQAMKKNLESIVLYTQSSRPKEIPLSEHEKFVLIVNPQKLEIIDCTPSFCELVGYTYQTIKGAPASMLVIPLFLRVMKRDIAYFGKMQLSTIVKRKYGAFRHSSGGVVYCLAQFHKISNAHAIVTILNLYEDIPPCLKMAFDHYLGLTSVHRLPPPPCDIEYCHCKLLHLPLPPENEL